MNCPHFSDIKGSNRNRLSYYKVLKSCLVYDIPEHDPPNVKFTYSGLIASSTAAASA